MKKFLLIFIILLSYINAHSQKHLQFNDVKLITSEETVPQGMVWKIENILPNTRLSCASAIVTTTQSIQTELCSTEQIIKVNNNNIYLATSDSKSQAIKHNSYNSSAGASETSSASANSLSGPIWLPSGAKVEPSTGVYAISVIEFQVIQ